LLPTSIVNNSGDIIDDGTERKEFFLMILSELLLKQGVRYMKFVTVGDFRVSPANIWKLLILRRNYYG
jgi:hypothetical protein